MATRKNKNDLIKVTLNLPRKDWEYLREHCPRMGAGEVVRRVLAAYVEKLKKAIKANQVDAKHLEVELEDIA